MADNDFLPFAVGPSANVLTQAEYEALTAILQNGFQSGIAQSVQLNKVWRQSSIMAAVLAQFISDRTGQDAIDDGTITTLLANLKASAAALNGDPTKTFQIAPATASNQAVQLGQVTALTSGRLLRTTVYRNNAGTLQSSVNGAAFSTASSTFTAQTSTALVDVEVQAAGGGGGGTQATTSSQLSCAPGGGAGGYARGTFTSAFSGVAISAGIGGTSAANSGGSTGQSSSFGALISATGGTGGGIGTPVPTGTQGINGSGAGGVGSGGQINSRGGLGWFATFYGSSAVSGKGGESFFSEGGTPVGPGLSPGNAGDGYGSGGSGGNCPPSSAGGAMGGAGANGCVIVREYA